MNTILRSYQKQDFLPLKHIIRETWHYDQMCSPKTADKLARYFLPAASPIILFHKWQSVREKSWESFW